MRNNLLCLFKKQLKMILLLPKNVFYLFMQIKPTIVTLHQIGEIFEQPRFVIRTTGPIPKMFHLNF